MFFVPDTSEFMADNIVAMKDFLEERESNSKWYTDDDHTMASEIQFRPIHAEPICISAEVASLQASKFPKFTASEESYADSMNCPDQGYEGSTQLMYVNGTIWPVGTSAIKGLLERTGIRGEGWEKLRKFNPESLSQALNLFMEATKGSVCVLVQDEKVRAVNSGRYAICPSTFVLEETAKWIQDERPDAKFSVGYVNHDYTMWQIDLSAYTDEVLAMFPSLATQGFVPAVQIYMSHTGTSSVSIQPCLTLAGQTFPLTDSIDCAHIKKGNAKERTELMKAAVACNFGLIFQQLDKAVEDVDKLNSIKLGNAYNALLRAMKFIGMPKIQGMEAADQFKSLYPYSATAYDCFLAIIDAFAYVQRDFPHNERKQFDVADSVGRSIRLKWQDYDIPGDFSW